MSIPTAINENEEYKYDPSSEFYNDECNKYSSDGNIDLTLYDRKYEFNNNNLSLCESGCIYKGYNSTTKNSICDCNIKNSLFYSNEETNTNELLSKIDNEKSSSNLGVMSCTNVLSSSEQIKSNSGFYSLLIILVIFIIVFIIFCIKGRNMLELKLNEIIYNKFEKNKKDNSKIISKIKQTKIRKKKKKKSKLDMKISLNQTDINQNKNMIKATNIIDNSSMEKISKFIGNKNTDSKLILKDKYYDIDSENDYELNTLPYIVALKYDKRTYCDYYCSLIKNKQLFAFTFCSYNDYNSGIIKKFIFFLSFALHYTINALFFNDSNMHQIYEDNGEYNFTYQFPKILISAISSTIILRIILITLVLTDKNIVQVKSQSTYTLAMQMKLKVLKCINIKFIIFFIINFILIILFGYYLTCFNAIYENTQIYLIENTFISFGCSLFYPFIINIVPSVLRGCSLSGKKANKSCLYSLSQITQLL